MKNNAERVYKRDLKYCEKIFGKNISQWLLDALLDVYERTKNNDCSKLGDSVFNNDQGE